MTSFSIFRQHWKKFKKNSGARGPRFDSRSRREKFRCPNTLPLVSFAGMTLDKCIVLRIGTLTGCPLCRESHPLCRLKNPTVISIWLLVGFHPATRSVLSTPADNTRKRVWQYIEKERKKERKENLRKVLNTCENIMEKGAFAPEEQILHFPLYFQKHDISRASNGIIMACGLTHKIVFFKFTKNRSGNLLIIHYQVIVAHKL